MDNNSFFKPILSTLGLVFSFLAAVTPIFSSPTLISFFLNKSLAFPSSVIAFIFGIAITWVTLYFHSYIQWNWHFFKWKINLGPSGVIVTFLAVELILFLAFFNISGNTVFIQTLQSLIYIIFFDLLIFVFAFLVSFTKGRYDYLTNKEKQADQIFTTLETNKVISPGIKIFSNEPVSVDEMQRWGFLPYPQYRRVQVRTIVQDEEEVTVVLSSDLKELVKVEKTKILKPK